MHNGAPVPRALMTLAIFAQELTAVEISIRIARLTQPHY